MLEELLHVTHMGTKLWEIDLLMGELKNEKKCIKIWIFKYLVELVLCIACNNDNSFNQ